MSEAERTVVRMSGVVRTHAGYVRGSTTETGGVVGLITVLMEEDNTKSSAVAKGHLALNKAVQDTLNALLMSENFAPGDIRWHFGKDGSLAFGLRTGPTADDGRYEYTETEPIVNDAMIGRWLTIATVLDADAGTVAEYIDYGTAADREVGRHERECRQCGSGDAEDRFAVDRVGRHAADLTTGYRSSS